jgi:hypothetical protein
MYSHSHRGFSRVLELCHMIALTVLTVWSGAEWVRGLGCAPKVRPRDKVVFV